MPSFYPVPNLTLFLSSTCVGAVDDNTPGGSKALFARGEGGWLSKFDFDFR